MTSKLRTKLPRAVLTISRKESISANPKNLTLRIPPVNLNWHFRRGVVRIALLYSGIS